MQRGEHSPDQLADRLIAAQHGAISRRQARECGLSDHQISGRLRQGRWARMFPGVYRVAVVPDGRSPRSVGALLAAPAGSALSHFSAARLHGLDVRPGSPLVWLTIPHHSAPPEFPGVSVHRSRTLAAFVTTANASPVTTAARTIVDLGEHLPMPRLRALIYDALREKRTTLEEIHDAWAAICRRPAVNVVKEVLAEFDDHFDSGLEVEADTIFRRNALFLQRQHRVVHEGRIIRRYDFADPAAKIGVEIDGRSYHSSARSQERDRLCDRTAAALGWVTLRFTTDDVRRRPAQMVAIIQQARARRASPT